MSLRAKLIAEQVVLLAMVCLVIGVVTIVGLRTFLVGQLDGQLTDASRRALVFVGRDRGLPSPPPPINAPGQGPGTINALLVRGSVYDAARQTSSGFSQSLRTELHSVLLALPTDGEAHDRALGELGDYRLLATRSLDEDVVVITGLPLGAVDDTILTTGLLLGGITLLGLTIAGVAGVLIVRRTLRPLDRMAATAARVAELPLDRGEVALSVRVPTVYTDPRTEVGKVGSALNRMLGHIGAALTARHASESRVRQFVADASHELRTPLAAIRGYAELAQRRGVDVTHALSRVESEAKRMTILVDDLLLLARLDAGRPLRQETLDLSRLVLDAVGDARVAGQDHRWRLDLPADPVMMRGDEARLHQVAANLLANGRTHTPLGTTITTRLVVDGDEVVLTVADDGPGIPDALLPEVFERFARGDGSRSRAQGSTGLGLAIVAAVVHTHHGTVTVTSKPGNTVFTVRLPTHS
ncbi:two-component system, OmpR family, sensor kinase [Actinokineospora alba]|uniref:histidine kinase n=1 Tax=Actinokineospora alba TaxID=504798 RepID=A0A1H0FIU1_9PSEU|nr:HAMP domain-containing sensor histidine kinase [Actinokineospora alba]TDP69498.1 two-component system OmpR family sensor kinase [Actinokineospora alba]SDI15432.1 two-component system, OmpR family, sensor kinase [Actinokineospora alba]SDN94595.1 two-component system, OmpR family, sensor kinase [Actinokineospora alba]